jgi:hypothetical protein
MGGSRLRTCIWIFLVLCLGTGCTTKSVLRVERPVRSVAVVPFFIKIPSGEGTRFVEDPISGRNFVAGEITSRARGDLTRLLYQKMTEFPQLEVISPKEVERAMEARGFEVEPIASARKIGGALGVEGVVLGWGFRYEERMGNSVSVEWPASVSFAIHLVDVKEGTVRWSGRFQETQQPLSENVLKLGSFLRRGGVWLTAKNLASVGMDKVLVSFPALKEGLEPEGGYEGE